MATFSKAADRASHKNRALAVNSSHSCMELYRANHSKDLAVNSSHSCMELYRANHSKDLAANKDTCKRAGNCMDKASNNRACLSNNRACLNNNRAVNNFVTTTGEGNNCEQVVLVLHAFAL